MRFLEVLGERYTASEQVLNNLSIALKKAKISLELDDSLVETSDVQEDYPHLPLGPPEVQSTQAAASQVNRQDDASFSILQNFQSSFNYPNFVEEPQGPSDVQTLSPLHKEPLFHQMSKFLTLDPDFLEPYSTSFLGTGSANAQDDLLGSHQVHGQDDFLSFFGHESNGWDC